MEQVHSVAGSNEALLLRWSRFIRLWAAMKPYCFDGAMANEHNPFGWCSDEMVHASTAHAFTRACGQATYRSGVPIVFSLDEARSHRQVVSHRVFPLLPALRFHVGLQTSSSFMSTLLPNSTVTAVNSDRGIALQYVGSGGLQQL
jgi:hypothetical protein